MSTPSAKVAKTTNTREVSGYSPARTMIGRDGVSTITSGTGTTTTTTTTNQDGGVGLASRSLSQGRRRMLDLVNKLHSTGVQVDIDLPQIAVIGSQSAGKSSLIESISGITLPRAAGTCTRCPTECRLSYSPNPWQCTVSLRFITDSKGQALGQAKNEAFGSVIYDKNQVEERIRCAQRAILNPSKPAKTFLNDEGKHDQEASELSFSNNCVSLQISGPDVADLSFCDLPGLIASVSSARGKNNDIALVQNLVTSYIKKPSCIILLTVACETDFENQGAHRLTKQLDPDGKRTIGVLTKPDRIPTGEESNWLPFIRNEKEALENNWYCVKQPSSNDLKQKITWKDARTREDEFFSSVAPWSELDPIYQKYLRTSNLVERLSSILSDLIAKRLPEIQEELERSVVSARKQLEAMPRAPSSDAIGEVMGLLHGFSRSLSEHVSGVPDVDGLIQRIRPTHDRFRKAIRATAPKFRPFESQHARTRHLGPATFLRNEEGEVYEGEASGDESGPGSDSGSEPSWTSSSHKKRRADDKIYIDDVLERAHSARTRELPGNFPYVVQKAYIIEILKDWYEPAIRLVYQIYELLSEYLHKLVQSHFRTFGQGHLEQRVRTIIQEHLKGCRDRALAMVKWWFGVEQQPFSLNNHYFADYREKFLAYYRSARQKHGHGTSLMKHIAQYSEESQPAQTHLLSYKRGHFQPAESPNPMATVLSSLAEIGLHGVRPEDLAKLLPHDPMEPALVIMADVRAYFQVAYKRFTDNIPLAIDHELVRGVERDALQVLSSKLGVHGPNGATICKELAQESPQNADRRADLLKKIERLETANSELLHVGL